MAEWDGVATALARINAVLYTTLAGVAAALVLFYVGDRTALRFKQWRLGGRSPRAAAAAFDLRDLHVLRVCNDEGQPWEDCKAHIVQFMPVSTGDVVTVVRRDSDGHILSARTGAWGRCRGSWSCCPGATSTCGACATA